MTVQRLPKVVTKNPSCLSREVCRSGYSQDFAEQARHAFSEDCGAFTNYSILNGQDRIGGYRNIPVAFKGAQGNLTPEWDPNFGTRPEVSDDDKYCVFDVIIGGQSVQHVTARRWSQFLQNWFRTKEHKVLSNVAKAAELEQNLLNSSDVHTDAALSMEVPATTREKAAETSVVYRRAKRVLWRLSLPR